MKFLLRKLYLPGKPCR